MSGAANRATGQVADTIEQCNGAYWDGIMNNLNNMQSQGDDMDKMYGMLKRFELGYCDDLFSARSLTIVNNCETDSFCEKLTRGFGIADNLTTYRPDCWRI